MSDNKIVYSNQGIKFLVDDQNNSSIEVSKLKGFISETDYKYLEVSGNVQFVNDVNITGDVKANNIELLPTSTKRVLFNKVGKISSSYDFMWDYETNKLSIVGEISASTFIKGDGTYLINLKSENLDYNTITIGNNVLSLGDSTTSLDGLSSVTSTWFTGSLTGNSDTTTKLSSAKNISSTGDISWTVSFDGSQNVSAASTLSSTGVTAGTYNNSATSVRPFTVDAKGRITSIGTAVTITPSFSSITSKPTTLSGYGITDAQPLDGDLTSIASLTGTSGYLKKTAANTWSLVSTIAADTVKTTSMSTGGLRYLTFVDSSGTGQSLYVDSGILYATTSNTLYVDNIVSNGSQLTNVAAETIKTYTFTSGPSDTWTNNAYYYVPLSKTSYQQQNSLGVSSTLKYLPINGTLETTYFKGDGSQLTNLSAANLNLGSTIIGVNNGGTGIYNTPQAGEVLIGTYQGTYNLTSLTPGDGIDIDIDNQGYITFSANSTVVKTSNIQTISGKKTFSSSQNQFTGSFSGDGSNLTNVNVSGISDGSISNLKLENDSFDIGTTTIYLGGSSTTLAGLTSVTSTNFYGSFSGNGSAVTSIATSNITNFTSNVRSQFTAGTDIGISNGVISYTGTSGASLLSANNTFTATNNFNYLSASHIVAIDDIYSLGNIYSDAEFVGDFNGDGYLITNLDAAKITNGTLAVTRGGTGQTTYTSGQLLIGNSSGGLSKTTLTQGSGISITNGNGTITISALNNGDITGVTAGDGLSGGGASGGVTLTVDSTVVRTTGNQSISGIKTFNSQTYFNTDIQTGVINCLGDFDVGTKFSVDYTTGYVGINDTTPSYQLDVDGITRINNYLIVGNSASSTTGIRPASNDYFNIGNSTYKWNDIWATNTTINTSDQRRKDLIEDIPHGVEFLNSVRPVQYKWKDYSQTNDDGTVVQKKYTRKHFGIIAQELKATLEEKNISTDDFAPYIYDSDSDSYAVRYGEFIPILIKSVQELSKENKELRTRLDILETLISSLME